MKHAIVTGATGPLGVALVNYLTERRISVAALVNPGSTRIAVLPANDRIRVIACDLSQLQRPGGWLSGPCDAFFHLGWKATDNRVSRDDPCAQAENILTTLEAVKLAHALGCKTFVGAGSQSELLGAEADGSAGPYAGLEESYGIAKFAAGRLSLRLCEQYGIRHSWARIVSVYGPAERSTTALMYCIRTLLRGEKPSLTKGEQLWDYLYSVDGARALYLIARKGRHGATYTLASGRSRPLREFFEHTRDCINASLPLGLGEKEYPRGQILNFSANIAALTNDTGFGPQYSFDEGIRETIAWVRKDLAEHTVSPQVGDSDSLPAADPPCTTAGPARSRASATTC